MNLFAALAPLLLLTLAFVIFCIVDLIRAEHVKGLPKWAWALVIILSVPLGGIVYLVWGRGES